MPIPVELHDGTQIHFPDGTPDHVMDATVQRHLGVTPSAAPDPDIIGSLLQAVGTHAAGVAAEKGKQAQTAAQQGDLHHKTSVITAAATVDAINEAAQSLEQAMTQLAQPLAELAQNAAMMPDLIKSINALAGVVKETGKMLAAAHSMPREIKLHKDESGAPMGASSRVRAPNEMN